MKLCFKCRGRLWCGNKFCISALKTKISKKEFSGASPSLFVGSTNYPFLNLGLLSVPETTSEESIKYNSPSEWAKNNLTSDNIIELRSSLVNSAIKINAKSIRNLQEIYHDISLSKSPIDVEIELKKAPSGNISLDKINTPISNFAELKTARETSNPKIPNPTQKVYYDNDLKATEAIEYLYKKGENENKLTTILSSGAIGLKTARKLVPTRWSITAVDDIISKKIIQKITYLNEKNPEIYFGEYLGNNFLIILFPAPWSYELFEIDFETGQITTNQEGPFGRKTYANECAGGYYATRLAITEYLQKTKKRAAALVIRVIKNYETPLGVWVVREAVRRALNNKIETKQEDLTKLAKTILISKTGYNIENIIKSSKLLKKLKQKTLNDFI